MARRTVIACLLILPLAAGTARGSGARAVAKTYVGAPTSAGVVFCGNPRVGADGAGRVCYTPDPWETHVAVDLADPSGGAVSGRILFFGRATGIGEPPDILGDVSFCDGLPMMPMPTGTTHMDVEVGDRVESADRPCGRFTSGTYGTATATFERLV